MASYRYSSGLADDVESALNIEGYTNGRILKRGGSRGGGFRSRGSSGSMAVWGRSRSARTMRMRYAYTYYGVVGGYCLNADKECINESKGRRSNAAVIIPTLAGAFCLLGCIIYCTYDCTAKKKKKKNEDWEDELFDTDSWSEEFSQAFSQSISQSYRAEMNS